MNYRQLGRTGLNVSILGYGASWLGGVFRAADDSRDIRAVHTALDLGINFIDVAPCYSEGRSEEILGRAFRDIPRERFVVATKIGSYCPDIFDYSAARVVRSVDESCARMGLETIDVLQVHAMEYADLNQIVNETLPAMVKLRDAGRIRHVGLTGLPLKNFIPVIDQAGPGVVETMISFFHYELNNTSLDSLLPDLKKRGIGVINAAPTGMGLLTDHGPYKKWPIPQPIIDNCRRAAAFCREQGVDIIKIAVQFAINHPGIATTVMGSMNPDHIRKNVSYAEEPIDFEMTARVLEILRPIRGHNFTRGRPENRDPIIA